MLNIVGHSVGLGWLGHLEPNDTHGETDFGKSHMPLFELTPGSFRNTSGAACRACSATELLDKGYSVGPKDEKARHDKHV